MSASARKFSALLELFYEAFQVFGWVVHPHNPDYVILKFNCIDFSIGPEDMIRRIQVRDLAKPRQMVFYQGQENGLYSMDYLLFQGAAGGGVPLEQRLVLIEPLYPKGFLFRCDQGGQVISRIVWGGKVCSIWDR